MSFFSVACWEIPYLVKRLLTVTSEKLFHVVTANEMAWRISVFLNISNTLRSTEIRLTVWV